MKTLKSQLIPPASRTPASLADQIECSPHALNVRDLMAFLKVSDQTIYRMIADQTIPFLTVRNSYRFDPKQIAECAATSSLSPAHAVEASPSRTISVSRMREIPTRFMVTSEILNCGVRSAGRPVEVSRKGTLRRHHCQPGCSFWPPPGLATL